MAKPLTEEEKQANYIGYPNEFAEHPMDAQSCIKQCKEHTLYTWAAGQNVNPLVISKAEGVYIYDHDGKKILDFNSQLMSVLIGHAHPKVIAAMKRQLDELIFVYPQTATQVRARLSELLCKVVPGMSAFYFTLGGAESNENAIRMAQLFTGKKKILARYRSYHGGTSMTLGLTGDPRRWNAEPTAPGVIHVFDPQPYNFSFGSTDEERCKNHLTYLEETIMYEGPKSIAAMIVETVTGTNGVLVPPKGWFQGLKALLKKYEILLICDEVMAGFGRTGKMMCYEHFDIVPDLVTMAKGLTSSYFPLGAVGMTKEIHDFFQTNTFWGGLTYNSHPLGLATAEAVLKVTIEEKLVENAAKMGEVMKREMAKLKEKHVSVLEGRNIGLFGMIDLRKNAKNEPLAPYNGSHPAMAKLYTFFRENGLFTFTRWNNFTCNPPLCITEAQLLEGFAIIDKALEITDAVFEK